MFDLSLDPWSHGASKTYHVKFQLVLTPTAQDHAMAQIPAIPPPVCCRISSDSAPARSDLKTGF